MMVTDHPALNAMPAMPVNVPALKLVMKALAPTSHQVPRQPLRK